MDEKSEADKDKNIKMLYHMVGRQPNREFRHEKIEKDKEMGTQAILDPKIKVFRNTRKGGNLVPLQGETYTINNLNPLLE